MKILVIPSWYPSSEDRINGSFFQEQAALLNDSCDIRVLFCRFAPRPSYRGILRRPWREAIPWLRFFLTRPGWARLPDDPLFRNPPLHEYRAAVLDLPPERAHRRRMETYLTAFEKLLSSGWRPDLLHAHSIQLGGLVAHRLHQRYGIPYVITEHQPFALGNYPEYLRDDIQAAFREANLVLSLGRDKVRQLGMSDIDVEPHLIYNFVDERVFHRTALPYLPGEPLKLVSIGAASHLKDHRTLLRALQVVKQRGLPFHLTLIGLRIWGDGYQNVVRWIKELDLTNEVTVIDHIKREEVSTHLTANHVYLMTSIAEGFPVSLLEALASGLFVIATRHGGTEDVLTDQMGRLVEIKNYVRIADHLQEVHGGDIRLNPPAIREAIVAVCGRAAFKARLLGYYRSVLQPKPAP